MSNGETPLSGIPVLGPILDVLGQLFGGQSQVQGLADSVGQVERAAWTNMLSLAGFTYGLFDGVLKALDNLKKELGKLLDGLFGKIIWGSLKKLLRDVLDWIANLRHWIRVHIAAWQAIQKQLDQARSQYFRKVLDVVQRIRKILVPFRLLHLKFASELDARLVGVESDLGRAWAKLVAHNNQVLGVLNDIIDPRQLMRPGHMMGSVGLMVGAIHGAIGALDVRALLCLGPSAAGAPLVEPWLAYQVRAVADIQSKGGDYGLMLQGRDQLMQSITAEIGGPTP